MRTLYIAALLVSCFFFTTCGDDESESYNITGIWAGPYNGVAVSGTMVAYLVQAGSNVTGTYSASTDADTGTVVGTVEGNEFQTKVTSIPFACDTYMKFTIQDSLHMSGYYRGYEACEDTGSASLVKQ